VLNKQTLDLLKRSLSNGALAGVYPEKKENLENITREKLYKEYKEYFAQSHSRAHTLEK